ncbi:MAG TPA: metalloregulator ArsR/SmtB family transcription factor [Terriglobales bacterium]|nr:metalloregulator ArsR/SmtB family transcription factor [Terriglobales bacterium]
MPFEVSGDRESARRVDVCPSAVLELSWALCWLGRHSTLPKAPALQVEAPALHEELAACWDDGDACVPDTSILAERLGALLTDEADTFLRGFERAVFLEGAGLELRSETPEVREVTLARLERLRRDATLRRRYAQLLGRVWDLLRPTWEETGREVVRRACADWSQRLRHGADLHDLLPEKSPAMQDAQGPVLRLRPRIVVTPMYFVTRGGFIIDMTTYVHIGGPASSTDPERLRRDESEAIANRLKVLSDGTRVALLRDLGREPASVTDLARRFHLAQPTVSTHVRLLREAGLLESQKDGARVLYTAPRERLDRVLEETRHLLLEH